MTLSWAAEEQGSRIEQIRQLAINLFHSKGYPSTSIRDIAGHLDIKSSSLYYHFPSKQDLLFDVLDKIMDELIRGLQEAVNAHADPVEKLRGAIRYHVAFHAEHKEEAFISHSELRCLTAENYARILKKRRRYEDIFQEILRRGVKEGVFDVPDVKVVSYAILLMCTGVAAWYSQGGGLESGAVQEIHENLVLHGILRERKEGVPENSGSNGKGRGKRNAAL